jgi:hypothetical protein
MALFRGLVGIPIHVSHFPPGTSALAPHTEATDGAGASVKSTAKVVPFHTHASIGTSDEAMISLCV